MDFIEDTSLLDHLKKHSFEPITNLKKDIDAQAYNGIQFYWGSKKVVFRKAKLTPKKAGLFVTLWHRNEHQKSVPFGPQDDLDYLFVVVEEHNKKGIFFFPRTALVQLNIVSTPQQSGKRGFRIYPSWATSLNRQAQKTQAEQQPYFIELTEKTQPFLDRYLYLNSSFT